MQKSQEQKSADRTKLLYVFIKILTVSLVAILALNFTFFIQRKISITLFWLIIAFCAMMAWWGIPYLKQK